MTLVADVFRKLETMKDLVRQIPKKSHFRRPFDKQHGKRDETILKSARQDLYHLY